MHTYEYLFTGTIILTILLASSTMITTISEPFRSVSEKEQLKVAAEKIMTQLLLEPGDPPDWGSNLDINASNPPKTFGLAKYAETTREAYVLDPDKVLRLNDELLLQDKTRHLFIHPSKVIDLLNLGREYGFTLEFYPALTVSVKNISADKYEVSVSSEYSGLPIVEADATARMYYYDTSSQKVASKDMVGGGNHTSYDGKCLINFKGVPLTEMKILVLVINYYGIRVTKVLPAASNVMRAYWLGKDLLLGGDYNISPDATEIIVTKKYGNYTIEDVKSSLNTVSEGKFNLTYVEPSTVAILAVAEDRTNLIFASQEVDLTYSSIPGVSSFPFAYSIERSVVIGGAAYIVRLYLWRMSW